jgi:hypothetical protein
MELRPGVLKIMCNFNVDSTSDKLAPPLLSNKNMTMPWQTEMPWGIISKNQGGWSLQFGARGVVSSRWALFGDLNAAEQVRASIHMESAQGARGSYF